MKHINKKGQIFEQITAIGLGILTLTIVLAIIFVLMSDTKDVSVAQASSVTVINESVIWVYGTNVPLDASVNAMELTCISVVES